MAKQKKSTKAAPLAPGIDWEALARDILKRQKNFFVTNAALGKLTGIDRKFILDAQNAKPVPAREMLLLARWIKAHPYRYLRTPRPVGDR